MRAVSATVGARRLWLVMLGVACLLVPHLASAHPAPFSYLDIRVAPDSLSGTLVLHDIDVARTLGIADPSTLADPDVVATHAEGIVTLMTSRVAIEADGTPITWVVDRVHPVAGQDAVGLAWHAALARPARATWRSGRACSRRTARTRPSSPCTKGRRCAGRRSSTATASARTTTRAHDRARWR